MSELKLVTGNFQVHQIDDDKHWINRADEIRQIAENTKDPTSRMLLYRVAKSYEDLAINALQRQIARAKIGEV